MLRGVRECFWVRGVLKRSHEDEKAAEDSSPAAQIISASASIFSVRIVFGGFGRLLEVGCVDNAFTCFGFSHESSKPWIVCFETLDE